MADGKKTEKDKTLRSDRRGHLRKQILVSKVTCHDDKGVFFGYCKDLSRGGMFLMTVNPKRAGEEFRVNFMVAEHGINVMCRCRIQWLREHGHGIKYEHGMGIQFLDLGNDIRDKIEEWARKQ